MTLLEQLDTVTWQRAIACGMGAYLLGCFATGYYFYRARTGRDIRDFESGATGARNVGRAAGALGFFVTLLGDFGKGALAVGLAARFTANELVVAFALIAVVVGHLWPVQLRFRGGKGVATSLGGLVIFDWMLAVAYAVVFALGFLVTRRTILPGLFAYACLPFIAHGLDHDPLRTAGISVLAALVLFAHRRNFAEEIPALAARCQIKPNPEKPKL
jgi:glycerol-3-phosphate acyltransferase PlsY